MRVENPAFGERPAMPVAPQTPAARRTVEFELPIGVRDDEGRLHRSGTLRKMTGRDEAILADPQNQRNGGKLVTELLASCVATLGELPMVGSAVVASMYSADRNYLLLKLRAATFGTTLQATYKCPSCGHAHEISEDLEELPVRRLAEDESAGEVRVELEDGYLDAQGQLHSSMVLRLPTGADESAVAPQMRKNASLGKNALLARCMKSLGDVPAHRLSAIGPKLLADLTMTDRRLIDKALNAAAPGVDLIRSLECPACGHAFKSSLDLSHFLALD
jgi:transcription elongation factor Elf1